jgi:hemoglobin
MQASPTPTPYERIGGGESVQKLVDRFYDLMNEDEEVAGIRQMHAKSLRVSREKLYLVSPEKA